LHVFAHLAQRVGQAPLDRLEDALAFDVLVLALVEIARRAVVLLEQLAVDLDRLAGRLLVAGEQRADHHHRRAEANALGDVAVVADAAVGDDRLRGHAGAPLQRAQLPAAGAEPGLQLGDADLARADLGRIGAPILEVDHRFRRGDVAGDHERSRKLVLDVLDHLAYAFGVAVRNVDRDVVGAHTLGGEAVDHLDVGPLDTRTDGHVQAPVAHPPRIGKAVEVEAVHHVEVAVGGQPRADRLVDHRLHVGRNDRQLEAAPAEFGRGVAFAAALNAALARQQQDVVVVEYFHAQAPGW
jgi:hypothetical protein